MAQSLANSADNHYICRIKEPQRWIPSLILLLSKDATTSLSQYYTMPYTYPIVNRNEDQTYGPTHNGHKYKPAEYHNPTAKKKKGKNRFKITPPQQYEVFRVADEDANNYLGDGGLYGFLDQMDEILGKDNEERIAFFPDAGEIPWHGYPVSSKTKDISDEVIKKWKEANLITTRNYRSLLKKEI